MSKYFLHNVLIFNDYLLKLSHVLFTTNYTNWQSEALRGLRKPGSSGGSASVKGYGFFEVSKRPKVERLKGQASQSTERATTGREWRAAKFVKFVYNSPYLRNKIRVISEIRGAILVLRRSSGGRKEWRRPARVRCARFGGRSRRPDLTLARTTVQTAGRRR